MEYNSRATVLRSKDRLLDLSSPLVMGIVNLTPDSFYSGSRVQEKDDLLQQVEQMILDGVDIVDLGAMSSRPGAHVISVAEEAHRLSLGITWIKKEFPDLWVSADAWRPEVINQGIQAGVDVINDISGGMNDVSVYSLCARHVIPYICMHMRGDSTSMQSLTDYHDPVTDLLAYFAERCKLMEEAGLSDYILDPGFGFAKTLDQNYTLLKNLASFSMFRVPLLIGVSRKSMIYKYLNTDPEGALNGSTALHMYALERGASILRVHDVKQAVETRNLYLKLSDS